MMYSHLKNKLLSLVFMTLLSTSIMADQTGIASWYGHPHHGRKTASGERYNMYGLSAAHRHIKLGTKVKVTNLDNNKTVIVKINDRGPFAKGRILDLSLGAKQQLAMNGTAKVKVEILD
jgi:rare lipoprotein A